MSRLLELFAACAPGLEPLLADEVTALAPEDSEVEVVPGGVSFTGSLETIYRANLELGLALKVLVRLARFRARDFSRLERESRAVRWSAWLAAGASVRVRATCSKSRLYHSGAVVQRVRDAIAQTVSIAEETSRSDGPDGSPGDGDGKSSDHSGNGTEPIEIHARLVRDECTLSLDTSGTSLHKRGYRLATAKAPLREDLARALLVLSGWDRRCPLVDPFCGSGTLPIEASLLARNIAPGAGRTFAFFAAPSFDTAMWNRLRRDAAAREQPDGPPIFASDRDAGAIEATRANAERANVSIAAEVAALSSAPGWSEVGDAGFVAATNPPYGARIGKGRDLLPLYQSLARAVRERPAGRLALVATDDTLVRRAKLPVARALGTNHGGKKINLYRPR